MSNFRETEDALGISSDLVEDMMVFDTLPPEVRGALRDAAIPYMAKQARDLTKIMAPPLAAAAIRNLDARLTLERRFA